MGWWLYARVFPSLLLWSLLRNSGRTTYWAVGRRLLPRAMRKQVKWSDLAQAFYRLDLYHALQSQGLCDRDAADFVERNFSPNYILVPREFLSAPKNQTSGRQQSPTAAIKSEQQSAITPKPDPYVAWPEIREHITPTPPPIRGIDWVSREFARHPRLLIEREDWMSELYSPSASVSSRLSFSPLPLDLATAGNSFDKYASFCSLNWSGS